MYQLVSAIGKAVTERGRWIDIDLSTIPMKSMYEQYVTVKAILSNPFIDHPVCLDMADVRPYNNTNASSVPEWLASIGSASLPTTDTIPVVKNRYAGYADAFHAGYKIKPVHPTASPDAQVTASERTTLFLSKEGLDFNLFKKYVLTTVNGYFHFNDSTSQGAWVMDGNRTALHANENQLGIISFMGVSEIKQVRITKEMIYKQNVNQKYRHVVNIDVGQDISNKMIAVVLGGYFHIADPATFHRVGDRTISIDMGNLPLLDRYHESLKFLDLSSLPIQRTTRNKTQVGIEDFMRDDNIVAYLTLSQSFIVVFDNPNMFVDKQFVLTTPVPGRLVAYNPPLYPLVNGLGKVSEYWYTYEDKQYSLTVRDNYKHARLYHTTEVEKEVSVGDQRVPYSPVKFSNAFFLKIGTNS